MTSISDNYHGPLAGIWGLPPQTSKHFPMQTTAATATGSSQGHHHGTIGSSTAADGPITASSTASNSTSTSQSATPSANTTPPKSHYLPPLSIPSSPNSDHLSRVSTNTSLTPNMSTSTTPTNLRSTPNSAYAGGAVNGSSSSAASSSSTATSASAAAAAAAAAAAFAKDTSNIWSGFPSLYQRKHTSGPFRSHTTPGTPMEETFVPVNGLGFNLDTSPPVSASNTPYTPGVHQTHQGYFNNRVSYPPAEYHQAPAPQLQQQQQQQQHHHHQQYHHQHHHPHHHQQQQQHTPVLPQLAPQQVVQRELQYAPVQQQQSVGGMHNPTHYGYYREPSQDDHYERRLQAPMPLPSASSPSLSSYSQDKLMYDKLNHQQQQQQQQQQHEQQQQQQQHQYLLDKFVSYDKSIDDRRDSDLLAQATQAVQQLQISQPPQPQSGSSSKANSVSNGQTSRKKKQTTNTDLYKTELCASYMSTGGNCPYGEKCQFAHGENELKLVDRPPKWRSKPCQNWVKNGSCSYNARCCFRHDSH